MDFYSKVKALIEERQTLKNSTFDNIPLFFSPHGTPFSLPCACSIDMVIKNHTRYKINTSTLNVSDIFMAEASQYLALAIVDMSEAELMRKLSSENINDLQANCMHFPAAMFRFQQFYEDETSKLLQPKLYMAVDGIGRIRINEFRKSDYVLNQYNDKDLDELSRNELEHFSPLFYGSVTLLESIYDVPESIAIECRYLIMEKLFHLYGNKKIYEKNGKFSTMLDSVDGQLALEEIIDHTTPLINFSAPYKAYTRLSRLLQSTFLSLRMEDCLQIIKAAENTYAIADIIDEKTNLAIEKNNREFYLREKLKSIRKELGEDKSVVEDLKHRISTINMSHEAKTKSLKELDRLSHMSPSNPDYEVSRNYIEKLLSLPWGKITEFPDTLTLEDVKKILDEDHYGMEKLKQRILEFIAVYKRSLKAHQEKSITTPILCLVGPPGVGKTSIAKSIARATNKKCCNISLSGVFDSTEIRGHRRTYIGSNVGTIIDKLTYVQVDNPVFILDEIDKVGRDRMESNVAGALLEVLDPEHNRGFRDLFLDVPYDLSKILFITTANTDDIPPALLDRLEVIYCSGYAIEEKVQIALHHILPNLMRSVDIQPSELVISEQIIKTIITTYTFESGVRSLKRLLDTICRKAIAILDRKESTIVKVTKKNLESFLGAPTISLENTIPKTPSVGRVMGLGYNNSGNGCIIMIEAVSVAGSGKFSITGNLGRVMEESSKIAFIVAKNLIHLVEGPRNNKIEPRNLDTYLHFPTASQKDGPSAGVGICLAILSSLVDKKIKNNFAITGEINLQGEVMPIGGILEKMQAAVLHNLEYIYLPQANLCNVKEIPEIIKSKIKIVYIKNIREILKKVFL